MRIDHSARTSTIDGGGGDGQAGVIAPPGSWRGRADRFLLVPRSPWYRLIVGLHDVITVRTIEFWRGRGAKAMQLPVTTGAVSSPMGLGSDSLPVKVKIGEEDTYLADSMQFLLEYGCRLNAEGCYYIMPSFRGEQPDRSHLSQFVHSEAELPVDLPTLQRVVEDYLRFLVAGMIEEHGSELHRIVGDVSHLERMADREGAFGSVTFDEAERILGGDERYIRREASWRTMTRAGEHELMRRVGEFVWVTHFDHLSVPFYQAFDGDGTELAKNADLLFGMGETVGAGERHITAEQTRLALEKHHVAAGQYDWYLRVKAEFPMLTSGFGLGVERFLMWVLRHDDIRDIPLVERTPDAAPGP
ncbi:asparagine ligase [Saccharothrix sp. AJ9571]|nr:asparagine ligase [Saccharothrix sp. AJ9571]